jgi:hypothetical protein
MPARCAIGNRRFIQSEDGPLSCRGTFIGETICIPYFPAFEKARYPCGKTTEACRHPGTRRNTANLRLAAQSYLDERSGEVWRPPGQSMTTSGSQTFSIGLFSQAPQLADKCVIEVTGRRPSRERYSFVGSEYNLSCDYRQDPKLFHSAASYGLECVRHL